VMNLITNASEALEERSGVITLSTGVKTCTREYLSQNYFDWDLSEGTYLYLEVSDTGCGMDKETLSRIFEPFFTTKFTGRGLGMSAVMGIVRGHKGALKIRSKVGAGTTFRILLPASEAEVAAPASEGMAEEAWKGSGRVLLTDDEESVRLVGKRMFERLGFEVVTAEDGREAIEIYKSEGDRIDLVVLDLTMPFMNGPETFRELRRIDPNVRVILSSGYSQSEISSRFAETGLAGYVEKPYTLSALKEVIRPILAK
ncbi:MAG: response regulator, partial [Acidobacteriota bacterium]